MKRRTDLGNQPGSSSVGVRQRTLSRIHGRERTASDPSSATSYQYDEANRLTTIENQQYPSGTMSSIVNRYNGLGDRMQQTVNGEATTYTLDLNSGLTQVLDDGTYSYLYGPSTGFRQAQPASSGQAGRIAQLNTASLNTDYFLTDALGSVRQLTNADGAVTLARSYDPYGEVLSSVGEAQTTFGFTNEYTSQGLVYLRARYYDPYLARFMTRDTWGGNANEPMSYNAWLYGYGNPANLADPTGLYPCDVCKYVSSGWAYLMCRQHCCDETAPTQDPNYEYAGDFNLSAYYTTAEKQGIWFGGKMNIPADPVRPGKYLSVNGGYTDDESLAQKAKSDFLQDMNNGVCMQGSGMLDDGRIIHCTRQYPAFEWGSIDFVRSYQTVAMCAGSNLLKKSDMIYVDCPWYKTFLAQHGNPSGRLEVTDVGQAPGLCNSAGHEGLDLYLGIGQSAYDEYWEFMDTDSANEIRASAYWPVYRKR